MPDIWGPIAAADWQSTPCIVGRAATEADVKAGCAVFYVKGDSAPAPINLPCCAIQTLDCGAEQPVVVVQAEKIPDGTLLGVRPLTGGNGVCQDYEVRLLPRGFVF